MTGSKITRVTEVHKYWRYRITVYNTG